MTGSNGGTGHRRLNFALPHATYDRYHPRHRYDLHPIDTEPPVWNTKRPWRLWDALEGRYVGPTFPGRKRARLYKRELSTRYERQFDL